ncbi:hypothetical protein HRJ34_14735 [Rhizorhabdus wittichii]|uniref:Uncharacterized protein n=1 Tax=Rhizorhabdus wittichii TaxID=160791 RepID=A0A975CZZ9_9SPHN|nr:hypothetical protein [Rhizorhabdus wittichii]QTH19631.1 hypothetical protein HRJ34_14735 [Rhizorhabdus wittichii]
MLVQFPYSRQQPGVDAVEEGYYLLRREGRVDVPIRIWFGWPLDPETNELLDRSPRWQIEINGILAGDPDEPAYIDGRPVLTLEGIWPDCRKHPIVPGLDGLDEHERRDRERREYEFRVARAEHARTWDANDPFATAGRIDPMTAPLPGV